MAMYQLTSADFTLENIRRVFFCVDGRLNRKRYIERFITVSIVCLVLALAVYYLAYFATGGDVRLASGVTVSVSVLETVSVYTLVQRRLHDLGYGRPVALAYLVYGLGQSVVGFFLEGLAPDSFPVFAYEVLTFAAMVFQLCLMGLRGVRGDNRYGADPLGQPSA